MFIWSCLLTVYFSYQVLAKAKQIKQIVTKTKNTDAFILRLCQLTKMILLKKGRTKESAVIRCAVRAYSIIALTVIRVKPFLYTIYLFYFRISYNKYFKFPNSNNVLF